MSHPALLVAALLLCVAIVPTEAAQSSHALSWTVAASLDGVVKYGEWLPVRATVSNAGVDRTVEVHAVVPSPEGRTTYVRSLNLAGGARKQVILYVLPNTFSRRLEVALIEDSQPVLEATVAVRPVPYSTFVIGTLTRHPDGLAALEAVAASAPGAASQVVHLASDDIPERAQGLASLDVIVINGSDTSQLSHSQRQAVADWVQLGGQLVLGGGSDAQLTLAGLPADLVPVKVDGTSSLDNLSGLKGLARAAVRVPGPFVVTATSATSRHGRVAARQADLPLVVQAEVGKGRVTFLALDLASPPFGAWEGELAFWRRLLQPPNARLEGSVTDVAPAQWTDAGMISALTSLPALNLPSVGWLVLLLALYVVMVGPANYLVLRRAGRLEWAWLTVPALTLTFSIGAYGTGYGLRGGEVILHTISVVDTAPGDETAAVRTYVGVFSPGKQNFTISLSGDPTVRLLNARYATWGPTASRGNITVLEDDPVTVRDLPVNQWSMQTVVAQSVTSPRTQIDAELKYADDHIRGSVRAPDDTELRDVVLMVGSNFARLGTLAPGVATDVDLELDTTAESLGPPVSYLILEEKLRQPGAGSLSREARLKQQILETVFSQPYLPEDKAGPLLVAWTDEAALPIRIESSQTRQLSTSLIITRPRIHFGPGRIRLPPGLLGARLVDREEGLEPCYGRHNVGLAPGTGIAVLEYRLPAGLSGAEFHQLQIILEGAEAGSGSTPDVALYNWHTEAWESLGDVQLGYNSVGNAGRFVDGASEVVRMRLQLSSPQRGCLFPSISLEGSRS